MEVYVVETPVGVFVVDDKLNVLDKVFFAKAPHLAAAELKQIQDGNITTTIIDALRNEQIGHARIRKRTVGKSRRTSESSGGYQ